MNSQAITKMNRRKFLKVAGATLGVSAVSCCGLGALATYQPQINFVEDHIKGDNEMNPRILVAYASKAGSTGEVATAIGKILAAKHTTVDVLPIDNVIDIQTYQAVVVGSAIRADNWISAATNFVKTHQITLRQIPTAFFTCGMTLQEETEENRQKQLAYMDPVANMVPPVAVGAFAGKMDYRQISFLDRTLVKIVGVPEGDFRNWDAIQAWATTLQPKLKEEM